MAGKTDAMENALLSHYFENANHANVGDATGLLAAGAAGNFYISLHTADPTDSGTQTSNEAAYTTYARVAVARSTTGWTVASGTVDNDSVVTFPLCTAGTSTVTHFGIGSASSGAGNLFYVGVLTASLAISAGITPEFAAGDLNVSED